MADYAPLGSNFDYGFQSDTSRDGLSPRAAYRMKDYIPQLGAPLRERGGWSYGSADLNGLASATAIRGLAWLPFPDDGHLLAVSEEGFSYRITRFDGGITGTSYITDTGPTTSFIVPPQSPLFWHKTGTTYSGIVPTHRDAAHLAAAQVKRYYDTGSLTYTIRDLGGTPPRATGGFSWGDYLVLLNFYDPTDNSHRPYRWAFSPVGAPEDPWQLTAPNASTIDFKEETIAGIPVLNAILAFGYENCWIVTGDTPPPGGNLAIKILWAGVGTFDARSVVPYRNYAIWANHLGVWRSDGASLTDLTADGGISNYYRDLVADFAPETAWTAAAGIYRGHYVLSIQNDEEELITTLACDLERKVWTEWTNIPAMMFSQRASSPAGSEELFFGSSAAPRVGKISSLWTPGADFASDADDTPVLASLETPYYRIGSLGEKRIRRIFVSHDIRGESATFDVSYVTSPEADAAYTAAGSLDATTGFARRPVRINKHALGVGLKIERTGEATDARLYGIEGEGHPWDSPR